MHLSTMVCITFPTQSNMHITCTVSPDLLTAAIARALQIFGGHLLPCLLRKIPFMGGERGAGVKLVLLLGLLLPLVGANG